MEIKLTSDTDFDEHVFDAAYGMAKRLVLSGSVAKVARSRGVVYTVKRKGDSVVVRVREVTR